MSLQEVAGACEGFSGADLSALLADAQLEAVHEVLARPGGADEVRAQAHHAHSEIFQECHIVYQVARPGDDFRRPCSSPQLLCVLH